MTIAELFVNLGVKGEGAASNALGGVQKGLAGISSAGLAAKAALLAVIYGAERLTTNAAGRGRDLDLFAKLTGLSTQELQKWELAAQRAGGSAEEMQGAFKGVQSIMLDMVAGKGAPSGMGILAKTVGFDMSRARDTFYVMEKLREFAKAMPNDIGNSVLKSFGITEGIIASFRSEKFRPDLVRPGDILSEKEIKRLADLNTQWVNFWNTLKMFSMKKVSIFGPSVLNELNNALTMVMRLTKEFDVLSKRFPELKTIAVAALTAIGLAIAPITTAIVGLIALLSDLKKFGEKKGFIYGVMQDINAPKKKEEALKRPDLIGFDAFNGFLIDVSNWMKENVGSAIQSALGVTPSMKPTTDNKNIKQDVKITNNFTGQDLKNAQSISDSVGKSVKSAATQLQGVHR